MNTNLRDESNVGGGGGGGAVRLLTGMDRNGSDGQEWTSITGTDLKIHPKIHVLSVFDEKVWLSNIKYQNLPCPDSFNAKKFSENVLSYPDILVPY